MITEWAMRLRACSDRVAPDHGFMEIGNVLLSFHAVSRKSRLPRLGKALFSNFFETVICCA